MIIFLHQYIYAHYSEAMFDEFIMPKPIETVGKIANLSAEMGSFILSFFRISSFLLPQICNLIYSVLFFLHKHTQHVE
jgi:hypothetical protein